MIQDVGGLDGVSRNAGKSCASVALTASVQGMAAQAGALASVEAKHGLVSLVASMAMDEAARGARDAASIMAGEVVRLDGGVLARIGGAPQTDRQLGACGVGCRLMPARTASRAVPPKSSHPVFA